jgi:glycosyltransferase involved in cell wall biosynthesis
MRLLMFNLATDTNDPILGFAARWIAALAKQVESIQVITMQAGRVEMPDNVRVYSAGKEKGYSEPHRAVEFYRHLLNVLRADRIDVCFSHMIPIFTVLAAPVVKAMRIPIVTWYAHRQVTVLLKLAHCLSDRMVTSAESAYRYKHDKVAVVGQGIDADLFVPNDASPDDPPLILSVGRLSPIKDPLTLVEAVNLLRREGSHVRCAFIGDAPERDSVYGANVKRRAQELGLAGVVQFVGAVRNEEVVGWYQRSLAHVNLCPTGALDKAALEAMACSRPSVVANEGFRRTLGRCAEQLVFRHRDAADLAAKLTRLLAMNAEDREGMGCELRRRVVEAHGLEQLVRRLRVIFEEVRTR